MSTLEYTIWGLRRGWNVTKTFIFAGAFAAAIVGGVFTDFAAETGQRIAALVMFGLWALIFGLRAHRKFFAPAASALPAQGRVDLELGMLLVVAAHAGIQMAGGLGSPIYPLIFAITAFLVVYTQHWVGFTLVGMIIGLELALVAVQSGSDIVGSLIHAVFIAMFAGINLIFTRSEMVRMRRHADREIARTRAAMEDDARDFRLTSATRGRAEPATAGEESARLSRCTVGEVRRSMFHHVDLLKRTMGLHTCLLLWLEGQGESLRLLECVSDSTSITSRKIDRKEGVVGAVLRSGESVVLKGLRPGYPGLPYYDDPTEVTDFLGVPVVEAGSLRGVLCADRTDGRPLGELEKQSLNAAVESILQIVSNERIFTQLQRAKSEQGKLLNASESLTKALTEKDVVDAALTAASQIASFEVAAVALVEGKGRQVVKKVLGEEAGALEGLSFGGSSSLACSVLKTRHYLPYRGMFDPKQQTLFSKKTQKVFSSMRSALVLPLVAGEQVLGTLTLSTSAPSAYGEDVRTTLQVMINQLGTSLQNAKMVRRLEEMATTDGLTGLPNHRVFQDELSRQIAQANRFNTETSIILCDVDKFKNVNDTFGHPVGDVVLKALGETLRRNVVRDTDLPARYGGEEFAIVCAGTDTDGAVKLAEKIRKDLEGQVFKTDKGDLSCTISMGVATFPHHARSKEDLVERSDVALYAAKEGGRNQVRVWEKGLKAK